MHLAQLKHWKVKSFSPRPVLFSPRCVWVQRHSKVTMNSWISALCCPRCRTVLRQHQGTKNGWVVSHTYKPPQEGFIILLFIPNGQWNCSSVERDSVLSGVSFLHKPRCIFSSFPFFLFCFGRGHFRFTQPSAAESWCLVTPAGAEQKHFCCIYAGLCSDPSLMETS